MLHKERMDLSCFTKKFEFNNNGYLQHKLTRQMAFCWWIFMTIDCMRADWDYNVDPSSKNAREASWMAVASYNSERNICLKAHKEWTFKIILLTDLSAGFIIIIWNSKNTSRLLECEEIFEVEIQNRQFNPTFNQPIRHINRFISVIQYQTPNL